MKKIIVILIAALVSSAVAAKCNFDKSISNFEKRMKLVSIMKGAAVSKEIDETNDGTSRIQKFSKPIKSGQYMGLRQYAVYGFIGCNLHMVRAGKINPQNGETAAEATIYLREDGNLKALCKGKGRVLRVNTLNSSIMLGNYEMEPNPDCVCYDENSIERTPNKKTWCAEAEDFDKNAVTLSSDYLDFVNPEEKKIDNSGNMVLFVENDFYFDERSVGTRTSKNVFSFVKKNMKNLSKAASDVEGEESDGSITIQVFISEDGTVSKAFVKSSTIFNEKMKSTIRDVVSSWNFGKSGKGDDIVFLSFKVKHP